MALVTTFSGPLASECPSQSARFEATRHGKVEKTAYSVAFGTLQSRWNSERRREVLLSPTDVEKLC